MFLRAILLGFASYRLTHLITTDDIFQPFRNAWYRLFPQGTKPADLVDCNYCAGFWVTLLVLLVAHLTRLVTWPIKFDLVLWWAVAGLQSLLSVIDAKLVT